MHVAASSTPSCARKPKAFGDDVRDFGDGEAVGVDAVAAVMSAAPVGADLTELVREPARLSRMSASRFAWRSKPKSFDEGGRNGGGAW